jgi:hypothetical protein
MTRRIAIVVVVMALAVARFAACGVARAEPCCGPITPAGERLARFLDGTGVDHLWLIGNHVNWETGEATGPSGKPTSTHCSAFVGAVTERLGVYVLRPPEHGQILLANAQLRWLRDAGTATGWRSLPDPVAAQAAANRGELVVEAFENPDLMRPGHIAVVRPSEQSRGELDRDGPREVQAGETNALDTSTKLGFRHHPGAWVPEGGGGIRYYAHAIDWSKLP